MTKNWDDEESAKEAKTYLIKEGSLKALDHIIKKYMRTRNDKKINPSKQTADEVLDSFAKYLVI